MPGLDFRAVSRRMALAGLGAAALAGRAGAQGAAGEIRVTPDAVQVIEGGRAHALSEVVFEVTGDYSGNRIGMDIEEGARIDVLRIRVAPGVTRVNRFLRVGAGARIGLIDVIAATQTAPNDDKLDGFVQIRGDDVEIGEARFRNIDRCMLIHQAAGVRIGSFECESYSKGLKVDLSSGVRVERLRARIASPHAAPDPGNNGLSVSDCLDASFPLVEIDDAAEHAVYFAGGGKDMRSRNVRFGHVITRRSGQCGFKCKAPRHPSEGVSIDRLQVTDAAFGSKAGPNEDGLRVENCTDFRIGELEVRREETGRSCYAGLYLNGVSGFALDGGHVEGSAGPMVLIEDSRGRPNAGIRISGLSGRDLRGGGYVIDHAHGQPLSDLWIEGGRLDEVRGDALRIGADTVLAPGPGAIDFEAHDVRGALVRAPTAEGDPRLRVRGV